MDKAQEGLKRLFKAQILVLGNRLGMNGSSIQHRKQGKCHGINSKMKEKGSNNYKSRYSENKDAIQRIHNARFVVLKV